MKENLKYMFTYKYNIVTMTKVFEPEKDIYIILWRSNKTTTSTTIHDIHTYVSRLTNRVELFAIEWEFLRSHLKFDFVVMWL